MKDDPRQILGYQNKVEACRERGGIFSDLGLAGPANRELLELLARETGGRLLEPRLLENDKARFESAGWTVTLEYGFSRAVGTRVRARYISFDGFRFSASRRSGLSNLARLIGMRDWPTGVPLIDNALVIRGNNPQKVRSLFADPQVQQLLCAQPPAYVWLTTGLAPPVQKQQGNVFELSITSTSRIIQPGHLRQFLQLGFAMLGRLALLGTAKPAPEN